MDSIAFLIFQVIFLITHTSSQPNGLQPGIPITPALLRIPKLARDQTECIAPLSIECANCSTLVICDASKQVIQSFPCVGTNKYCYDGSCVSEIPQQCITPPLPSNACPGPAGFYPSSLSCNRFVYCDADRHAAEYVCPSNLVYDHTTGLCKRRVTSNDCPTINCAANRNQFIVYPPDPSLYFFCGTTATLLLKCPSGAFNTITRKCEFECSAAGRFPIPGDDTKFYLCVEIATNQYQKFIMSCPDGHKFTGNNCVAPPPVTTTTTPPPPTTLSTSSSSSSSTSTSTTTSTTMPTTTTSSTTTTTTTPAP